MSGRRHRRLVAPVVLLALVAGCGSESERASTLRPGDEQANPSEPPGGAARPGGGADSGPGTVPPATTETLAERVATQARALAGAPYRPPARSLPRALTELDYDTYRSIRFRPERALWRGTARFEVQLMHPGSVYATPVQIHLVEGDSVFDLPFMPEAFSYDGPAASLRGLAGPEAGYSGFRIHVALNDPDVMDEVVVFQGSSYFRLVGPGQVHGLSSRGLGLDIGGDEVFPGFRAFWLERPAPHDSTLVFHALLDSPPVTGAYRFEVDPGERTVLHVDARLFARSDVPKLGIAPMSSMFLHGSTGVRAFDDYRPEVHDSDGLLMHTRHDEWIWRPLSNRRSPTVTALLDVDPRGFGLVQRARAFDRYLDLEARYDRRPSQWVRVEGAWGAGSVQLFEMPTESEFNDNVAASWVPDEVFAAGHERTYSYDLVTFDSVPDVEAVARVVRTRVGRDALPGEARPAPRGRRRFVIDFAGGPLGGLPPAARVDPVVEASAGEVSDLHAVRLPSDAGWRASFRLAPDGRRLSDLRLHLELDGERLSETWSYLWDPREVG